MRKKSNQNEVELPFKEPEFVEKWNEWMEYRKQARLRQYVAIGLKKTFSKLLKDSGGDVKIAIEMIDQALAGNWMGIHPLKNSKNGSHIQVNPNSNKQGISDSRIQAAKDF